MMKAGKTSAINHPAHPTAQDERLLLAAFQRPNHLRFKLIKRPVQCLVQLVADFLADTVARQWRTEMELNIKRMVVLEMLDVGMQRNAVAGKMGQDPFQPLDLLVEVINESSLRRINHPVE